MLGCIMHVMYTNELIRVNGKTLTYLESKFVMVNVIRVGSIRYTLNR